MNSKYKFICDPQKRYDFVFLFDVRDGNPNGDPDAGNLPRVDPETMHGLITDVALKRKIRDYVALTRPQEPEYGIFIQSKVALNRLYLDVLYKGIEPPSAVVEEDEELLDFLEKERDEFDFDPETRLLRYIGEGTKIKDILEALKGETEINKDFEAKLKKIAEPLASRIKNLPKVGREKREEVKQEMARLYFDIRMFGAVLTGGTNAGQVRGPVQLTFSRSVDPVLPLDLAITRKAVTKEADRRRKETEMARKPLIPYGLYRAHGFYNPFLAERTGVSKEDLKLFWEALQYLFEFDRSASRGEMAVRGLFVFRHEDKKGNAPAHKLFELVKVRRQESVETPRSFADYMVATPPEGSLDGMGFAGVTLVRLV
ncbi:type I-C CRISPR-associated protein Cas7/Csd2 [Moorella sp. E306M]|uniref:type I-C CRISPR-associated protein Cas7/Csd2 n=1 Tax=Moorella sp. E306M TaxID=2572683 RepID=UPI0010FFC413|nr:type I-C CRISPR-associated protein Cas7/Csd2 [Moorella sp. E306M]GEA17595.1 hypothetical protein E306M_07290 [Moorella sp. E306M]